MTSASAPRTPREMAARPAPAAAALPASFAFCRSVARRRARNFYYGMKLTPEPKRSALYAIYTWMRAADDLADAPADAAGDGQARAQRLAAFRRRTAAVFDSTDAPEATGADGADTSDAYAAMWPAVSHVLRHYRIPMAYLDTMIDGQLLDQQRTRYASFTELHDYCYQVASVVGLTCIQVWGYEGGEATRQLAADRGVALQLTNILRDLVEDARRDRVYLPADELARFGFDPESFKAVVLAGRDAPGFQELMRFQIERAQSYFDRAAGLEAHVDAPCRPTCWALMRIYHGLLEKIAARPQRVLTTRVRLSSAQKALIGVRAIFRK